MHVSIEDIGELYVRFGDDPRGETISRTDVVYVLKFDRYLFSLNAAVVRIGDHNSTGIQMV